jgi:hypothetical protein
MHVARSGLGVVALNGRIYAIGGRDDDGVLNTVEEYDPDTDTWAIKNPMPTPRRGLSVVAFNNRIYAIGGYDNDSHWLHTVEEYDPVNDTWAMKSNITYGHAYGVAAEINGKIYITSWNTTEVYDPSNDTSWLLSSRNVKRMDQTGAAVEGRLYAMGGIDPDTDYSKAVNTNYQYNPCSDRWTQVLSMPTKRWDAASAVVNGKIYVMGGGNSDGTQNVNEVYIPDDDYSWYFSVNTVNITTNAGWNLISLPWQTNPISIEDALSSINWTKSMVYLNGTWYTYNRERDAKYNVGFPMVDNKVGIWVECTDSGTIYGPGQNIGSTTIHLHSGWNLVAYPSSHDSRVSDALSGIPWEHLETVDGSGNMYGLSSDDYLVFGRAYWIYLTEDVDWTVEW